MSPATRSASVFRPIATGSKVGVSTPSEEIRAYRRWLEQGRIKYYSDFHTVNHFLIFHLKVQQI